MSRWSEAFKAIRVRDDTVDSVDSVDTLNRTSARNSNSVNSVNSVNDTEWGRGEPIATILNVADNAGVDANAPPPGPPIPAEAAALLAHLRHELLCRVTVENGLLLIRPAIRCPAAVLAAIMMVEAEVVALVAAPLATVVYQPTEAEVETMAQTTFDAMNRNPACRITDPDTAMAYCRGMAVNRLIAERNRVQ